MQTPPPSPMKEPNPTPKTELEKSPLKKTPSPKNSTTIKKYTDDQNPSTEKTTHEENTRYTSTPSTKLKKLDKKKFKLKEIVKLDFVPMTHLAQLSRAVNQESTRRIRQLS